MHPPEAHGPANRSDAAKYECHCFEVLHAEKCVTVRDSKSVGALHSLSGLVPEVMDDGVTGFVVNDIENAVEATQRVRDLSRVKCREIFEKRFAASRMASDYINVYTRLADSGMRRVEQSLQSSIRSFQSAWPTDDKLRARTEREFQKF